MFELTVKAETLRNVFSILTSITGEIKLVANQDGWRVRAVDPAHVAMVDMELDQKAFSEYQVEPMELGLNVERLLDHIKTAKADEDIHMKLDADNRMIVSMSNLTLKFPLVDSSGFSDPKVPNLTLPVSLKLNSAELQKGLKASQSLSDYLTFNCQDDKLTMTSTEDLSSMTLELKKGVEFAQEKFEGPAKSSFSLDYFSQLMKGVGANRDIVLHIGNSYPLKLEFEFSDGLGKVRYLLAPRIESA